MPNIKMSKRGRYTDTASSFHETDEATDTLSRNVLSQYMTVEMLRNMDMIETLMGDNPHLKAYASEDRPDLRTISQALNVANNKSTINVLRDDVDSIKRRVDGGWSWTTQSALNATAGSAITLASSSVSHPKKDAGVFLYDPSLSSFDYECRVTMSGTSDLVTRNLSQFVSPYSEKNLTVVASPITIGNWGPKFGSSTPWRQYGGPQPKVTGLFSEFDGTNHVWYFYVPMKLDPVAFTQRLMYYQNVAVTAASDPTISFTKVSSPFEPTAVIDYKISQTLYDRYDMLVGSNTYATFGQTVTCKMLTSTEWSAKCAPYISEVQDGSHEVYTYVFVPYKLMISATLTPAYYNFYTTGTNNVTANSTNFPLSNLTWFRMHDSVNTAFHTGSAGDGFQDDHPAYKMFQGSIPLPPGNYVITFPTASVTFQYYKPVHGISVRQRFAVSTKDIAAELSQLQTSFTAIQTNFNNLAMSLVDPMAREIIDFDSRLGTLDSRNRFGRDGGAGLERKLLNGVTIGLNLANFVVDVLGLIPVVGAEIAAIKTVIKDIVEMGQKGVEVYSQIRHTFSDEFIATNMVGVAQTLIPFINALSKPGAFDRNIDNDPTSKTLQNYVGSEMVQIMQDVASLIDIINTNQATATFEELTNSMTYFITPLSQIGPAGTIFYNALLKLGIAQSMFEEISLIPVHAFLTAKIVNYNTSDSKAHSQNFIISVGDFTKVGNLGLVLQALGVINNNPSLLGYYKYEQVYDHTTGLWSYVDPVAGQNVTNFYNNQRGTVKLTRALGQYHITVKPDVLESYLQLHQKYAPIYNLFTHNCQVQSKQIIAFGFTSYRPSWWTQAIEQELIGGYIVNRSSGYQTAYGTAKSNYMADTAPIDGTL